jgi:hypothetical protein
MPIWRWTKPENKNCLELNWTSSQDSLIENDSPTLTYDLLNSKQGFTFHDIIINEINPNLRSWCQSNIDQIVADLTFKWQNKYKSNEMFQE